MRKFTLYWSSLDMYEKCPQKFLWTKGWGTIELGRGPGKGKELPFKSSRHHAIMGIVIQAVIEKMYNDELWREPRGLADRLLAMVDKEWAYQVSQPRNWIDYRVAGKKEELLQVCRDGVLGYLKTMKEHRFAGEWTKAELDLIGWIDKYNPVGGRPDVTFRRKDTGITILDGKNAQSKGKYTDPDQLRWYAMMFYLAYRQMPDRLGFVYYRYPYGTPILDDKGTPTGEVESGVDWVGFTKDDIRGLAHRAVTARKGMDREKFAPTPTPPNCKWCDFETVCPARQEQKAKNRRRNPKSIDAIAGSGGFADFEL